jgi:hypothetical protein
MSKTSLRNQFLNLIFGIGICSPQDESVRVEGLADLGFGFWDLGFAT